MDPLTWKLIFTILIIVSVYAIISNYRKLKNGGRINVGVTRGSRSYHGSQEKGLVSPKYAPYLNLAEIF